MAWSTTLNAVRLFVHSTALDPTDGERREKKGDEELERKEREVVSNVMDEIYYRNVGEERKPSKKKPSFGLSRTESDIRSLSSTSRSYTCSAYISKHETVIVQGIFVLSTFALHGEGKREMREEYK